MPNYFVKWGSTVTIALLLGKQVHWCHVGDSRLYRKRKGQLQQLTTDHTFVQDFIREGTMTLEEAAVHPLKNMLDQCVGCQEPDPESGRFDLLEDDRLLLCTDGLHGFVGEEAISDILDLEGPKPIAEALIQAALEAGGKDNVTVVVLA